MKTYSVPISLALVVTAFTACSPDGRPGGQVAVVVNGDEISIHQLNAALAYLPVNDAADGKRIKRAILDRLVQQQLLVQKAREEKLDRNPQVMQAMESAKAQVLARAYLQRVTARVADPSPETVAKFVPAHPALFAKRRIYRFEQIWIDKSIDASPVRDQLREVKGLKGMIKWLKEKQAPFKAANAIANAEQLPLDFLTSVGAMKDGEMMVIGRPDGTLVVRLLASQLQPVPEDQRTDAARRYMINQAQRRAAEAELQQLVHSAKVEYANAFADLVHDDKAVAYVENVVKADHGTTVFDTVIDEGLKGLQ